MAGRRLFYNMNAPKMTFYSNSFLIAAELWYSEKIIF